MTKRKGELSRHAIDQGWPHRVALPAELLRGDGYATVHLFCEGLSLCTRTGGFRRDDRDFVVYCFAQPEHAEKFRERFNGEPMTPAQQRVLARRLNQPRY